MKRPINIPLWISIIIITLLVYDSFVVPYIDKIGRENAVTKVKNPSTEEHNTLAKFLVKTFNDVVHAGQLQRTQEHADMKNDTVEIKNNTQTIILMLKNGTN